MSEQYTVKQGDTLLSIAHAHGFRSWEAIWKDAGNDALRKKRTDPQVLAAGDVLVIPDKLGKSVKVATLKKHTFTAKSLKAYFRTSLVDEAGKPLANKRFTLSIGDKKRTGSTDEKGVVELEIPPKAADGTLEVDLGDSSGKKLTFHLRLGHLDPIEKVSGVKARLTNLGFTCGSVDDALNAETVTALRNFQIVHRLEVTGEADDATKKLLVQRHDRR